MAHFTAMLHWQCQGPDFVRGQYSREHTWTFDGGVTVPASASPHVVPSPWSNPAGIDPEEAFIAAVASCHLLTFLWLASRAGFQVDQYDDTPIGVMTKNEHGIPWVSGITLHPMIKWSGAKQPSPAELAELHHRAHEECFIANSIKTVLNIAGLEASGTDPAQVANQR